MISPRKITPLILAAAGVLAVSTQAYEPPLGIPDPDFGIVESHTMYAGQTYAAGGFPCRDSGWGSYTHYVDNTDPICTDSGNEYGTAAVPRCSPPTADLPEGSVIGLHGGPYLEGDGLVRDWANLSGTGTPLSPVFFRGHDPVIRTVISGMSFRIEGAYFVVENLDLVNSTSAPTLAALFHSMYGIDIATDIDGIHRPQGSAWDRGAHEFSPAIFADGFESGDDSAWFVP